VEGVLRHWRSTQRILAFVSEQQDFTLREIVSALHKRRIQGSRSALARFFARHGIAFKTKSAGSGAKASRRGSARPTVGSDFMMSNVEVVSRIAALLSTAQCEDEQRTCASIEDARANLIGFGAGLVAGNGVAGLQHYPVGVELELPYLARGEETVIHIARLLRQRKREG
jgi:hypothetical protein